MIELGVRTARSPPGPCLRPYLHSRVAAAQRLLTATLPTPWVTPGGLESFFVELGEPVLGGTLPENPPELDVERVVTLAGHYGAEVLTNWP
jgi:hypothetical protein